MVGCYSVSVNCEGGVLGLEPGTLNPISSAFQTVFLRALDERFCGIASDTAKERLVWEWCQVPSLALSRAKLLLSLLYIVFSCKIFV